MGRRTGRIAVFAAALGCGSGCLGRSSTTGGPEEMDAARRERPFYVPREGGLPLVRMEAGRPAPEPDASSVIDASPDGSAKPEPNSAIPPDGGDPFVGRFVDVLPDSLALLTYRGDTGERGERHGPGGVFTDLDGDTYPDLVLVSGPGEPTRLYVNVSDGQGRRIFEGRPFPSGSTPGSTGAIAADYDNDGDRDVYVTNFGSPNQLFRNRLMEDGGLSFEDVTATTDPTPGVSDDQMGVGFGRADGINLTYALTAAWADVNRDGLVDLYVGNHNGSAGSPEYGDLPGERDVLYLNQGDGTFVDWTVEAGVPGWANAAGESITAEQRFASSNAVLFTDLDRNGWPDLIVTNKTRTADDHDMIYLNRGQDSGEWLGFNDVTYDLAGGVGGSTPLAMGLDSTDLDGDSDFDVYVTDWAPVSSGATPNELWINELFGTGAGTVDFSVSPMAKGVFSWGAQFQDFDGDGHVDLHVTANAPLPDLYYHNENGNLVDRAAEVGLDNLRNARSNLTADFDQDGFVDIFIVSVSGGVSRLYRNGGFEAPDGALHRTLALALVGDPSLPAAPYRSSRDALGAVVKVQADVDRDGIVDTVLREVLSGSSNAASTSSLDVEVGLGLATVADVEVAWPSGRTTRVTNVTANQRLVVTETP